MNNPIRRYTLLLFLSLLALCLPAAIERDELMKALTVNDGLSGESVTRIITDPIGQIWIATSNGVNRYNGKRLVSYRIATHNTGNRFVRDICAAGKDIYIACQDGVYRLRQGDSTFRLVTDNVTNAECLAYSHGLLYYGCLDGLMVYDGHRNRCIYEGRQRMSVNYSVRSIAIAPGGKVWFLTKYELNSYDPHSHKVKTYALAARMSSGASFGQLALAGDMLYIGTKNNGLWQWNPLHNRLAQVKGVGNIVTTLNLQDRHNLCVSCDGSGAYRVNVTSGEIIETFSTVGDNGHRLPSDAVYCYYRDTNGVNWFGFYRHGLLYTYHKAPLFRTFRFGQFSSGGMDVRSFYIHEHQYVLGTNHGLWFVDTRRNITHCFKPRDMNGAHIITRIVWYDGKYFIATYDGGLHVLDPQTMHIGKLGKDALLDQTSVTALAVSPLGRLWIGSSEGIYILDTRGRLTRYTENNARIYGGQISGIVFDRRGQAWLTGPKGISIYSSSTKTFSNACFPKGFFNNEGMLSGIFNHSGKLLFYSSKRVYYTDSAMHDFGEFRLPEGIFEEMLYSVLDDRRGHYWVASEIGLFRMDYDRTSLQYFGYGEGLVSQLVNVLSLDENGRIWIATSKGLLYVDQYDVRRWEQSTHYKVLLYDIQCAGTQCSAMTESLVNTEGKLKLHWNVFSDRLTFKIVLADFARSEGRLFEYRIDGSAKWRTVRDNQNVEVSSLFLGRHHIQIRQAGAPGTTRTYTLVVIPSWLAITELLMLVIVAALFLFWNHYRKNTNALLKERDEMEKALIEVDQQQQSEELSEDVGPSDNQKYERVHINEAECANIVQQMRKYIESNKPYLRPDYKMSDLAGQLHLSPSKLSQIFNLFLKENYYEFINRYRLEEFKKLVAEGGSSKYTLTALSEKCGFKKSNFFSTFRKVEGMTPTEYMKKKGY